MKHKTLMTTIILFIVLVSCFIVMHEAKSDKAKRAEGKNAKITPHPSKPETHSKNLTLATKTLMNTPTNKKARQVKSINDEWCLAHRDLTREDALLVAEQNAQWREAIGVAMADVAEYHIDDDKSWLFGHRNVVSYEYLTIDELIGLSEQGDEWAMVTYLQKAVYHPNAKLVEYANELLVTGKIHHALGTLVGIELVEGEFAIKQENDYRKGQMHLVNALAYAAFAANHYSSYGVGMALTMGRDKDTFEKTILPLLQQSKALVRQRYNELVAEIELQREQRQIFVHHEAPNAVKRSFHQTMASFAYHNEYMFDVLQDMDISPVLDIDDLSCTDVHFARLKAIDSQSEKDRKAL